MALLLELAEGLDRLPEFVESSALELSLYKMWLKILGMFILPILWLIAGCFFLCLLPLWKPVFLSWSRILNCHMSALG